MAHQLVAYGGRGGTDLFRAGILVSGFTTGSYVGLNSINRTQPAYDALVSSTGCTDAADTVDCLRSVPLSSIYDIEDTLSVSWGPVIDGDFLQQPPAYAIADGKCARVPIILGSNSDEGLFMVNAANYFPNTTDELAGLIAEYFGLLSHDTIQKLLDTTPEGASVPPYSLAPDFPWCAAMAEANLSCGSQYRRAAALLGDYFAHASRRYMSQLWSQQGLDTYSFRFDTDPTALPITYWVGLGPGFAVHGAELAYEMGLPGGFTTSIDFYPPVKNVSTHIRLSHEMNKRWIAFAHSLDPNLVKCMWKTDSGCLYSP